MLGSSILRHVREAARRFVGANEGNIAVIFTIAAIPIISFVGAAIDYSRANSARTSMQAALDSTALMLSKDLSSNVITTDQIGAKAQTYFAALYTNPDAKSVSVVATYTANNGNLGNTVTISGSGSVNTDFMKIAGYPTIPFSTSTTSAWGNVKMRVALALDNTGSMKDNGKITALRNAVAGTGGLIDQLSGLAKTDGDVYISVVPFAKVVNVGASNAGATWIDQTDWLNPPTAQPNNNVGGTRYEAMLPAYWHALGPGTKCPFTTSNSGFTCTSGPTSTSNASTIPSSGTYSGYICPSVDANSHTLYNGCWDSEPTNQTETFCSGSSSCSCPTTSSGAAVNGCTCSGSGSSKSCTGYTYVHNWTQPGPNDSTDNSNQPRVNAYVGFLNHRWTASNWGTPVSKKDANNVSIPWQTLDASLDSNVTQNAVQNNYIGASTNPISTWTGCVTDRTQSFDTRGDAPTQNITATLFPANQYYENSTAYCNPNSSTSLEPIMPLTYTWSSLKAAVNAMQPTGGTNQAIGLAWAWQTLLTTGPVPAPAEDSNTTYNRVIIILSDGLNTEDRWPAYGNGSSQTGTDIDNRQALLCQNLKSQIDPTTNGPMYTIYAIQVDTSTPADPTSTVLQNCASSPDKFFMLTSSGQIATTFTTIGTALSELRVAR
ncbi:TadE/TadG family type IV pilus assembly protein [Bradyrhizobium canariense]|nr:TadE/TadG family type IV pilus assembly protein [Bradyrhizobium canariense]